MVLGNVIRDGKKLVGPSLYAALVAAKLNAEVTLVTRGTDRLKAELESLLKKYRINLVHQLSWGDTEIKHEDSVPKELKSDAGPIFPVDIEADIAHIATALREVSPEVIKRTKADMKVIDAKGYTKYADPDGTIREVPWLDKEEFLRNVNAIKVNPYQLYYLTGKSNLNSAMELLRYAEFVILTLAERGAIIFHKKKYYKVPAYQVKVKSRVGSGVTFTTAFLIKYHETEDVLSSAYFASAAASFALEKGVESIPNADKIEKRAETLKQIFIG